MVHPPGASRAVLSNSVRVQVLQCVRCSDDTATRLQAHVHLLLVRNSVTDRPRANAVVLPSVLPFSIISVIKLVVRSMFMPTCTVLAIGDRLNSRNDLGGPDAAHYAAMTALRA